MTNPAIGILTGSNIYLAQVKELNYSKDIFHLIYTHTDPVYQLRSFTSNNMLHRLYICSPNTLYRLDLRIGSNIVPLSPIDDTPCRSSLTYVENRAILLWAFRHTLIQLDFNDMSKDTVWNSTLTIADMTFNNTIDYVQDDFYFSVTKSDHQSSVVHCRADYSHNLKPLKYCQFIGNNYEDATALAINGNNLYVADRLRQAIFVLTLSPSGLVLEKDTLPLNTSTVADIQSMSIYGNYLFWLTVSGHVRSVSLRTYEVRNIFWFDEPLLSIRLVSFLEWSNRTTPITPKTTTIITAQSTTTSTTTSYESTTTTTTTTATTSTSISETTATTTAEDNYTGAWRASTYVTSAMLGIALLLCAAMITCVLLNYRLARVVPHSFTNIFHILRSRTTVSTVPVEDESMT